MQASDLETRLHQLVDDTRKGDAQAYRLLLREVVPVLRKAAIAQLARFGRAQDSEDVVQETLMAIHLKLHTYDDRQRFLPWLRAVLTHKLIDFLRRQRIGGATVSLDDDAVFFEPADPHNPEAAMIRRDLALLLGQLKPPAGDIVHALKVEGASVSEVAKRFALSESNVKVIVHRAMTKLSQLAIGNQQTEGQGG